MRKQALDSYVEKYDHPFTAWLAQLDPDLEWGDLSEGDPLWAGLYGRHVITEDEYGSVRRFKITDYFPDAKRTDFQDRFMQMEEWQ